MSDNHFVNKQKTSVKPILARTKVYCRRNPLPPSKEKDTGTPNWFFKGLNCVHTSNHTEITVECISQISGPAPEAARLEYIWTSFVYNDNPKQMHDYFLYDAWLETFFTNSLLAYIYIYIFIVCFFWIMRHPSGSWWGWLLRVVYKRTICIILDEEKMLCLQIRQI